MTTTEILRRLLDERGVKWDYGITGATTTRFRINGVDLTFMPMRDGLICTTILTPEQAIAAALRQAVRHPKPHEKWTTVLLPEIAWSWDDSWPDYLSVAHDAYGEWRTYVPEATLGAGTCEADETDRIECVETVGGRHYDIHIMECTECGHTYEHVNGDYKFCPRCGRKRKDVEE